jgi:hypothetical protein
MENQSFKEWQWQEIRNSERKDLQDLSRQWETEHQPRPDKAGLEACVHCNRCLHDERWVRGHKPSWWVCPDCLRVFPCRHRSIEDNGTCSGCGDKLSNEIQVERRAEDEAQALRQWKLSQMWAADSNGSQRVH